MIQQEIFYRDAIGYLDFFKIRTIVASEWKEKEKGEDETLD